MAEFKEQLSNLQIKQYKLDIYYLFNLSKKIIKMQSKTVFIFIDKLEMHLLRVSYSRIIEYESYDSSC